MEISPGEEFRQTKIALQHYQYFFDKQEKERDRTQRH